MGFVQLLDRLRAAPFSKIRGVHIMPWEANTVAVKLSEAWNASVEDTSITLKINGLRLIALLKANECGGEAK